MSWIPLILSLQLYMRSAEDNRPDSFLALALSICSIGRKRPKLKKANSSVNSSLHGAFVWCKINVLCSYASISLHLRQELLLSPWCPKQERGWFHPMLHFMASLGSPIAFEGYMTDGRRENMPGKALIIINNSIHNTYWFQANIWTMEGGLNNMPHWQTKVLLIISHFLSSTDLAAQ